MIKMKTKIIKVDDQGDVVIPQDVTMKLKLKPRDSVIVREDYNYIILEKPRRMFGERIERLLKDGLKNVEWEDIEKEREDRV